MRFVIINSRGADDRWHGNCEWPLNRWIVVRPLQGPVATHSSPSNHVLVFWYKHFLVFERVPPESLLFWFKMKSKIKIKFKNPRHLDVKKSHFIFVWTVVNLPEGNHVSLLGMIVHAFYFISNTFISNARRKFSNFQISENGKLNFETFVKWLLSS